MTTCDTKVLYDTEFEAELAVARHMEEMKYYRCPGTKHYHLTHIKKAERQGFGYKYAKCEKCNEMMRKSKLEKHKCPQKNTKGNESLPSRIYSN